MLWVLIIARISTLHQDPRSLAEQIALCEKYVRDRYRGAVTFVHIQGQGSGEVLDRRELIDAEEAVESGKFDLVIVEDLGRVCRRNRATDFCELCEDSNTRLIAINDSIDTEREDWTLNAFFASFKHETSNKDTSKRIRRSLRHRFEQGGVNQTFPYGYVKPDGIKSDADLRKDEAAVPVYDEVFRLLESGISYAEVADWMNSQKVPTGEWNRNERWDGAMVSRVVHNPILKGWRRRNQRVSKRVNKNGRRKSVKAPPGEQMIRVVPHLAFIEPERYDRVLTLLAARHRECARGRKAGIPDGREGMSKKRTVWPGQHVVCGVCGRLMYWGGHGQQERMMCAGARDYSCWNVATFDGSDAGRLLAAAVLEEAENLPEFDQVFLAKARAAAAARRSGREDSLARLDREITQLGRELANLAVALAKMGPSETVQNQVMELEAQKARLASERVALLGEPDDVPELPPAEELKERVRAAVGRLAFDDPAFWRIMSLLVPRVAVSPYRPLDGGKIVLRAVMTVNLAPLLDTAGNCLGELVARERTVDLFDPPQRVACLRRVVELRAAGATERGAAQELGITVTAAQKAMALHRCMLAAGVSDPYELLTAPPEDDGKVRRHRHPRYRFQPLDGYPLWPSPRAA
jgi:DNA invertase Pin-like site-specific DNA recombinase